jgi:hypothetical protein
VVAVLDMNAATATTADSGLPVNVITSLPFIGELRGMTVWRESGIIQYHRDIRQ